jgi:hypothetical protein
MERYRINILTIVLLLFQATTRGQQPMSEIYGVNHYTVVFWNVENFFDTRPDPYKEDKNFSSGGEMRWNWKRFAAKRDALAKTMIAAQQEEPQMPAIIGLAEVENRFVLNQLLYETPLYLGDYRIIHKDSPDRRGIDVALLYRKELFRPLQSRFLTVETTFTNDVDRQTAMQQEARQTAMQQEARQTAMQQEARQTAMQQEARQTAMQQEARQTAIQQETRQTAMQQETRQTAIRRETRQTAIRRETRQTAMQQEARQTAMQQEARQTAMQQEPFDTSITPEYSRDILYVKGVLHDLDTIHLFVNHWPSKYGGEKISAPKRKRAATILANICDSILDKNPKSNILAMGDFNDTPEAEVFGILERLTILEPNKGQRGEPKIKGTIKFQGVWERIDHFFVSPNLLDNNEPVSITPAQFTIVVSSHLLERDRKFTGVKPRRTYIGPRYNGGISDHLPIILKIQRNW